MHPREAEKIAKRIFGLTAIATRLNGEYDFNFHLKTDTSEYILKISHPYEEVNIVAMQDGVLQWLNQHERSFDFPRLQATHHDPLRRVLVRLLSYIPGKLFAEVINRDTHLMKSLGEQVGQLSRALQGCKHHPVKRSLKWDLQQAAWFADKVSAIEDASDRRSVNEILNDFFVNVHPRLIKLRQSIIHNDLNDYNILVMTVQNSYVVSGFIDFGDVIESATVGELAIAITYAILDHPEPLVAAASIVQGYHGIFPLEKDEINILIALIKIRLCCSVVNSALRKQENPHDAYLTISEQPAWNLLKKLSALSEDAMTAILKQGCQRDAPNPAFKI